MRTNPGSTHWENCWQEHIDCALAKLVETNVQLVNARAQVATLRTVLKDCADDLEGEIKDRYGDPPHPGLARKYERDMEPVALARAALAGSEAGKPATPDDNSGEAR